MTIDHHLGLWERFTGLSGTLMVVHEHLGIWKCMNLVSNQVIKAKTVFLSMYYTLLLPRTVDIYLWTIICLYELSVLLMIYVSVRGLLDHPSEGWDPYNCHFIMTVWWLVLSILWLWSIYLYFYALTLYPYGVQDLGNNCGSYEIYIHSFIHSFWPGSF